MKSFKEIEYSSKEIAESLVFPDTRNSVEREDALIAFRKLRKEIADAQTEESKIISQLLQLKFQIEDYLNADTFKDNLYFGHFLKEYIQRLEKKNKEFAEEIDIDPTELSQVINKRRKPTEKLVFRLDIHSNRTFPAIMWFKLIEKERIHELLHDKGVIDSERKHVRQRIAYSF